MLSLFDHDKPVPEKSSNLTLFRGSVADAVNFLKNNPKYHGKFLSDHLECDEQLVLAKAAARIEEVVLEDLHLGGLHICRTVAVAQVAHMLNCDAERARPHPLVVVTDSDHFSVNLFDLAPPVPTDCTEA